MKSWHNAPLNTLPTALHLFRDMIMIAKESTIAFSAIDKLVALFQNLEKAILPYYYAKVKRGILAYGEIWHPCESSIAK